MGKAFHLQVQLMNSILRRLKGLCIDVFRPWQVNGQGGCSISWRKHGYFFGFCLSILLAGWVDPAELPQPLPQPSTEEAELSGLTAFLKKHLRVVVQQ